jgi:hypothetical protein
VRHLVQHSVKRLRVGFAPDFASFLDEPLELLGIVGRRLGLARHDQMIIASLPTRVGFFHRFDECFAGANSKRGGMVRRPIEKRRLGTGVNLFGVRAEHFRCEIGGHNVDPIDQAVQVSNAKRLLLQIAAGIAAIGIATRNWIHGVVRSGGLWRHQQSADHGKVLQEEVVGYG